MTEEALKEPSVDVLAFQQGNEIARRSQAVREGE